MKLFKTHYLILFTLSCLIIIPSCSQKKKEVKELELALQVNGYSRTVSVKINGEKITFIKGGGSQSTWLYHKNHSLKESLGEKKKELFCLRDGPNSIEISHQVITGESPLSLEVSLGIRGKTESLLIYRQTAEQTSGQTKGTFEYNPQQPNKFKQMILE